MRVDALIAAVMPSVAPPPSFTVSEWTAANRRLPASSASRGARWSNETAPYLIDIMNATADPTVRKVVIEGASQTGKSESALNAVGFFIAHDPSSILWMLPGFEDAKRRSRGGISDMLRTTPSLKVVRGRRAPRGSHEAESTLLEKVFPGGSLILAGSGTPNSYAGMSVRRAIADEFDRFAILAEGDPATLLTNRTSSFYDGLVMFISTPVLVDGPIDAQFKTTDQRRWFVSCPNCGHQTWLAWSDPERFRVVYEGKDPDTARLECPQCHAQHDEVARRRMIAAGAWRPTATPVEPGARGFHLPALISLLGDVTLPRLVQKWLAARANGPSALRAFLNTILAEGWEDRGGRVEPHALATRLEDYGLDVDAPRGVICLTAGVDVQLDRFEVQVIGWGRGGESWVIDAHVIPGDPSQPHVQAALFAALDEKYRHTSGVALLILATCVDSGYLPEKVAYALAARRPRRVFAIKGIGGRFGEPSILKYDTTKPPALLNVDGLKLEIALGLEMAAPGPGYMHLSRRVCDEDYLSQICSEHREKRWRSGVATLVWVQDRADNHALDTAGYARGALKLLARISGARSEDSMLSRMATHLTEAAS
ncbi:MAG: terminase gpA endonuclease subunit [Acidobacteriota bacterium]